MKKCLFPNFLFFVFITSAQASVFQRGTYYEVCFTPYQNCTGEIVKMINQAKQSIYVQGYSFTSDPIANALVRAKKRGVKVLVILDKSQFAGKYYSSAGYLIRNGIPVWEDFQLDIAHNKVMIVDKAVVETGSFNYTVSAQHYNAENVLIIHNKTLAHRYLANWYRRQKASKLVKKY
ncbi:phospholipase D family protein [Coxiella burnetii]|uniref:phospholipase D family nuclease n=1 Tax=Coxiella burnetii TaxID=777 RepID=UPI0000ECFF43|nr:phospholipase D family protein [Coxiella burnetii]ACJ20105.1 phospholipase D [Coxiella burnetii CbuK_Q154]AIT63147.1 Phospholipase D [Coxiella burnetii str. Namibia]EAX33796.1 phospholipase [Coxiella burnetii 'MSU Goat Q177']PHH58127.1 phospholipase D family protein [Coxiella burnetii]UYK70554.1 phospholipase D family protein [Coxiella burnetii]